MDWLPRYTAVLLVLASGCGPPRTGPSLGTEAADPADRIRAIVAAVDGGTTEQRSAVAALVDRLEDEDEGVRFYAIAGLHRLTGERLGFQPCASAARRAHAVERWREYLAGTPTAMSGGD